jgi:hypothetical protein
MSTIPQDTDPDLEDWLLETWPLTDHEQSPLHTLVKCIAAADYSIRNAGDLDAAEDICPGFQQSAVEAAALLRLPIAHHHFSQTKARLAERWHDIFDRMIGEVRAAWDRRHDKPPLPALMGATSR